MDRYAKLDSKILSRIYGRGKCCVPALDRGESEESQNRFPFLFEEEKSLDFGYLLFSFSFRLFRSAYSICTRRFLNFTFWNAAISGSACPESVSKKEQFFMTSTLIIRRFATFAVSKRYILRLLGVNLSISPRFTKRRVAPELPSLFFKSTLISGAFR